LKGGIRPDCIESAFTIEQTIAGLRHSFEFPFIFEFMALYLEHPPQTRSLNFSLVHNISGSGRYNVVPVQATTIRYISYQQTFCLATGSTIERRPLLSGSLLSYQFESLDRLETQLHDGFWFTFHVSLSCLDAQMSFGFSYFPYSTG
jgi:hypothetical protein